MNAPLQLCGSARFTWADDLAATQHYLHGDVALLKQ